ncbi:hypothetical protein ACFQU2_37560 [Siccirubricoccus deserti]
MVADLPSLRKALREPVEFLPKAVAVPPAPRGVRCDSAAWHGWLDAQAEAYRAGGALDLGALDEGAGVQVVSLPGYPFARDRHWFVAPDAAPTAIRLYAPAWQAAPTDAGAGTGAVPRGTTLALVNSPAEAAALEALLPGPLHPVLAGMFCDLDATPPVIRPGAPQDVEALLRRLPTRPDRVADLWALGTAAGADPVGQARALFVLAQALAAAPGRAMGPSASSMPIPPKPRAVRRGWSPACRRRRPALPCQRSGSTRRRGPVRCPLSRQSSPGRQARSATRPAKPRYGGRCRSPHRRALRRR